MSTIHIAKLGNNGTKFTVIQRIAVIEMAAEKVRNGETIEAGRMAQYYREIIGEYIDWHEFAYYFDYLNSIGFLAIVKNEYGRLHYTINVEG